MADPSGQLLQPPHELKKPTCTVGRRSSRLNLIGKSIILVPTRQGGQGHTHALAMLRIPPVAVRLCIHLFVMQAIWGSMLLLSLFLELALPFTLATS